VSEEYRKALETANQASRDYTEIQEDYLAGRVDDITFLEAKLLYKKACDAFDIAYDAEESRGE
jgi:hypothetical protein